MEGDSNKKTAFPDSPRKLLNLEEDSHARYIDFFARSASCLDSKPTQIYKENKQ
jgi:hypothetical protein